VGDNVKALFSDIVTALQAYTKRATVDTDQGCVNGVDFSRARSTKAFQDLIHFRFLSSIFIVRIGRLMEMVINAMQSPIEFG